jgi:hypothetical protein
MNPNDGKRKEAASMKKKTETRSKTAVKTTKVPAKTKATSQAPRTATTKAAVDKKAKSTAVSKSVAQPAAQVSPKSAVPARPRTRPAARRTPHVTRVATTSSTSAQQRQVVRMARANQFNYMRAPGISDAFDVGDTVEVFCDHERNSERVRGWIKGIVVQVDNKLVAVQFRSNVYLTDGWMVPDRILWYSLTSDQIRPATFAKRGGPKIIPDY